MKVFSRKLNSIFGLRVDFIVITLLLIGILSVCFFNSQNDKLKSFSDWGLILILIILLWFRSLAEVIRFFRIGKRRGDIIITKDWFIYRDGMFGHKFDWSHVSKVRITDMKDNILKIFFIFNSTAHLEDYTLKNPMKDLKNYYRRKLVKKHFSIHLDLYEQDDELVLEMQRANLQLV